MKEWILEYFKHVLIVVWVSLVAHLVKNQLAMQETYVRSLD